MERIEHLMILTYLLCLWTKLIIIAFKSQVVSNPIDLLKVQQKIKTDEYEDVEDFISDIELLVNNAKAFYRVKHLIKFDVIMLVELACFAGVPCGTGPNNVLTISLFCYSYC